MKAITELAARKRDRRPISMVTCYDTWSARLIADTPIDIVLVGDSGAMVAHGHPSTVQADLPMMVAMTSAVRRGLGPERLLVADMPFPWHRYGPDKALEACDALLKAGANAVKIEGVQGLGPTLAHLVQTGVPVMGHLGLMPQSVNQTGGYKVQGRETGAADLMVAQAREVAAAGCFALVLEMVPAKLAYAVTEAAGLPTIGIGSGAGCDGQVLVLQDLLGLNPGFKPKFLRTYLDGASLIRQALTQYHDDVVNERFPSRDESF